LTSPTCSLNKLEPYFIYYHESSFQDARAAFRQVLTDSTHNLDVLAKKLGSCVEKARPYYDARVRGKEVINSHSILSTSEAEVSL